MNELMRFISFLIKLYNFIIKLKNLNNIVERKDRTEFC